METIDSQEPIEAAVPPERFPRLWGVILFRLVMIGYCIYLFFAGLSQLSSRMNSITIYDFARVVMLLAVIVVWSLLIVVGLLLRKRWGGWLVFLFGAVFWAVSMGYIAPGIIDKYGHQVELISMMVLGVSVCEGLYVSTRLWGGERAVIWYSLVAVVFFSTGVTLNRLDYNRQRARVQPVFTYVDSLLWDLPADYSKWELDQRIDYYGYYSSELSYLDVDAKTWLPMPCNLDIVTYDNLGSVHKARKKRKGVRLHLSAEEIGEVCNQQDVLNILRKNGSRLSDLRFVKAEKPWGDVKLPGEFGQLMHINWIFKSQSTGIEYCASSIKDRESRRYIQYVEISIPQKEYERLKRNGWK